MSCTTIAGIAASENLDTSGERIELEGLDISSLAGIGVFNYEHNSNEPSQVVGKVLTAKKIFKEEDCDTDHQKKMWGKVGLPFLYVSGELFDGVGHKGAQEVAAIMRYDKENAGSEGRQLINFSIEGSRLQTEGGIVKRCIARKVSITVTPCNKVCVAEELEKESETPSLSDIFKKSEKTEVEILEKAETKYMPNMVGVKTPKRPEGPRANYTPMTPMSTGINRPAKPMNPNPTSVSPSLSSKNTWKVGDRVQHKDSQAKSGKELYNDKKTYEKNESSMKKKKKTPLLAKSEILKALAESAFDRFEKKNELVSFLTKSMPNLTQDEVMALAKTYSYVKSNK